MTNLELLKAELELKNRVVYKSKKILTTLRDSGVNPDIICKVVDEINGLTTGIEIEFEDLKSINEEKDDN
jgi:hypothetical protein